MPVQEDVLDLIFGRWRSQTLHAGTKLGVFEYVDENPKPVAAVAAERHGHGGGRVALVKCDDACTGGF